MPGRPGSAQPQAPSAGPLATSATSKSLAGAIPPALATTGLPTRGSVGSGATIKNFGPPTMQSDTVVFQAAKIPLSSARLSSAPGSAVAPSSVVASRGGASNAREGRHDVRHDGDSERRRALFAGAQPPPHLQHPARDRQDSPIHHGSHPRQRVEMEPVHPYAQREIQSRRPRSPPRERQPGSNGEVMHGSTSVAQAPPRGSVRRGDAQLGGEQAMHGGRQTLDQPMGQRRQPTPQREARPSSADNKNVDATRRVVRLTVRVMKDGDKLGFGIRNDSNRKLKVSTLQSNSTAAKSSLKIGDTILSVNGTDLTGLGFLEVIQQLKATKPGELVFDIERSLDEDDSLSGDGSQQGETMDLDSPLDVAERRFGPEATRSSPALTGTRSSPGLIQPPPLPQHRIDVPENLPQQRGSMPSPVPSSLPQQRMLLPTESGRASAPPGSSTGTGRDRPPPEHIPPGVEPARKRPRPATLTPAQMDMELARMGKQHRAVLSALTLELQKERTERTSLEEKNGALRKRLQNMLIECDEVRVKANSTVASIKEHAQRDIHELKQALQAARAQLRLQDCGPDVARTDSIVKDLLTAREQLNRLRKAEVDRANSMSNRFIIESRQADREAHRTRERLINLFENQLRDVARRNYNNNGVNVAGKDGANLNVVVQCEGLRRLAFVKIFGLPCSYEWYASDEYHSTALVRHVLQKQDDILDVFGNTLCHEERAGLFIVAAAPMNVAYDPTVEKLTLSCSWAEQNQLRELARNFLF